MAKIRVAQIKDLSLTTTDGVREITIGTGNSITPLAQVNVAEAENSVITALAQSGNNLTATTKTFADIVSGGLTLTPAVAETGVITSLTKSGNTLTAVYTDNSSALTATSLTVMSGYTQDANGEITGTTVKSFNATQFKEANNVISLHENVLNASTYLGKDAIAITTIAEGADAGKKQVALTIDAADQVLTQSATGLKANVTLAYDSDAKEIKLIGKNDADLGTIDATDFIKDGMLSEATIVRGSIVDGTFTEDEDGAHYIKLVWNTDAGKQDMYVPAETLVDSYTAGNAWITIDQSANTISHATVTVGVAGTYGHNEDNVTVDSIASKDFKVPTFTVDAAGHVTAAGEKTVTISLPASINTAIQDGAGVDTDYIETEVVRNTTETNQLDVTVTAKIGTFSNETAGLVDGLATTTAVEAYVEDYVAHNAATQMKREVLNVNGTTANLSFVPVGDVAITQNGIDLNPGEYTIAGNAVNFNNLEVAAVTGDVFVAYYMYNPSTQA